MSIETAPAVESPSLGDRCRRFVEAMNASDQRLTGPDAKAAAAKVNQAEASVLQLLGGPMSDTEVVVLADGHVVETYHVPAVGLRLQLHRPANVYIER